MTIDENQPTQTGGFYITALHSGEDFSKCVDWSGRRKRGMTEGGERYEKTRKRTGSW
nr:MAG TPA: hypothetical protein [Caudoviricetes sp.]